MNLVVIAAIVDDRNNLVGVRILDSDNTVVNVKDVQLDNVIRVLASNQITIQNIGLSDNGRELEWTNGAMERYTKVIDGYMSSKRPHTIVYKTDDGYIVSDPSGRLTNMSESSLVYYGKVDGLSNGKIARRGYTDYVSSINGEYKYRETYTGEKINLEPLKPVVIAVDLHGDKVRYNVVSIKKDKVYIKETKAIDLTHLEEFKSHLFQYKRYTLAYRHIQRIKLENEQDVINFVNKYRGRFNNELQVLAHKTETLSFEEIIQITLGQNRYRNISITKKTDSEIIKSICNAVSRGRQYKVYNECTKDSKIRTVLKRDTSPKGIEYSVLQYMEGYNHLADLQTETLEYIYKNPEEYTNVKVKENIVTIRSLDGVYRYNMDKIHSLYKREVLNDPRNNTKALIMGKSYKEYITQSGELQKLSTSLKTIVIPDSVIKIAKCAITVNESNEKIIFGPNVVDYDSYIFQVKTDIPYNIVPIKRVEFKGTEYNSFVEDMANYVSRMWSAELVLNNKLTGKQLARLIYIYIYIYIYTGLQIKEHIICK